MYSRQLSALRVVQYYTSLTCDIRMKLGESHLCSSDSPEIVLARACWLVNQGAGKFNILAQNCEHAAFWCKTGRQWCKQALVKRTSKVPFPTTEEAQAELFNKIDGIRNAQEKIHERERLMTRITFGNEYFLSEEETGGLLLTTESEASLFYVHRKKVKDNVVHLRFQSVRTGKYLYVESFRRRIVLRDKEKKGRSWGFKFMQGSGDVLMSLRQCRNWVSVHGTELTLVTRRCDASPVTFKTSEKKGPAISFESFTTTSATSDEEDGC